MQERRHVTFVSMLLTAAVTVTALLLAVLATSAHAQGPMGPSGSPGAGAGGAGGSGGYGFRADLPGRGGGYGLMLMQQDLDRDRVMLQLRDQDCDPLSLGRFDGGVWSVYVPGAPAWVNQDFPATMRTGGIYAFSCAAQTPVALRLTNADAGGTFTVAAGARVRVALDGNPTTGYTWAANPVPDASILVQQGDPFFVPMSNLVGASGHQVFDFVAQGPGTVQLQLEYARPFETVPPEQTWSVTITVTP